MLQNYPNPFNPETWIPFELNQDSNVSLAIYDTDGRTQSGEQVASGTYFYTLKTEGYVSTQKMIILK